MIQKSLLLFTLLGSAFFFGACPQAEEEPIIVRKIKTPASHPRTPKISDENKAIMLKAKLKKLRETIVSHDERTCTKDSDCSLIDQDCCGCAGGGRRVGINKAKTIAVGARRANACDKVVCPSIRSDDSSCVSSVAKCINGQCEAKGVAANPAVKTEPIP